MASILDLDMLNFLFTECMTLHHWATYILIHADRIVAVCCTLYYRDYVVPMYTYDIVIVSYSTKSAQCLCSCTCSCSCMIY